MTPQTGTNRAVELPGAERIPCRSNGEDVVELWIE